MAKRTGSTQSMFDDGGSTVMPEGFYAGDKPNSNLNTFVGQHAAPYTASTDDYQVRAFAEAITTTKATAIYNMHTYWSKKPHDAIRRYVRHYTKPGDVVLDPFSGSGGTALAALMDDRKAIAIDRSPAATFITKNQCHPIDPQQLETAFAKVNADVADDIKWLYGTKCDRCRGEAIISNTVYSQLFQCPKCMARIALFDCQEVEIQVGGGKTKKANACPHCFSKGQTEIIRSQSQKYGYVPVLVSYVCQGRCKPARSERRHDDPDDRKRQYFADYDLKKIKEIEDSSLPYWIPEGFDMSGFSRYQRDALFYYGVREVADLFTKRNRWALAAIREKCLQIKNPAIRDYLLFTFQSVLLTGSILQQYREAGGGFAKGTYYVPQISLEREVLSCFMRKQEQILKGVRELQKVQCHDLLVSTQSSCDLSAIPANSIDYIFTDPPYAEKVQYGELNYVWEAWLNFDTSWHTEEIIVNDVRKLTEDDWASKMRRVVAECYRVLKPGRWLSLCYHDTSEGTWELIQDIMAEAGFVVDKTESALFIDTGQKSYNQLTADKSTKRDLVLNFRKPRPGDWRVVQVFIPENVDIPTFMELGRQVIRDFLTAHPGATKDRIYDALVSSMVRKGQMEAHDFDALLKSVAEEVQQQVKKNLFEHADPDLFGSHVQSRWYLKETADQIDHAEQVKEEDAAARLETFMTKYLQERREYEGVHYSDLFEQYLPVADKPRRLLADWLPEYFVKTPGGTWRVPNTDERKQLADLRTAGTLRRIKRFANALLNGVPVPEKDRPGDRDLLDWLRQCRRAGLYDQGRAIFEKGGLNLENLAPEEQIEADDDYRICARRGSAEDAKPKKQRKKKQDDE